MAKLPRGFQLYVLAVITVAGIMAWRLLPTIPFAATEELLLFLTLIALASMFPIPSPRGGFFTVASILFYVLISVHGAGAGLLVAGPGYAVGAAVSRKWIPWRTIFNGAQMGISVAVAGLTFQFAGGTPVSPGVRTLVVPLVLSVLAFQITNNFLVAFYYNRLRKTPLVSGWFSDMRDFFFSNLFSIPTVGLLAVLYVSLGPTVLLVYLIALPLQRRANLLYLQQKQIYDQAIHALVLALDANFPQGRGHSRRVASLAGSIAREMGLSESSVEGIELGALLHDVGLIGVGVQQEEDSAESDNVRFRDHTRVGASIVREFPRREVVDIVLHHHEKFDGTGYPEGLQGNSIPLGARIVAVAEVLDSMLSGGFPESKPVSVAEGLAFVEAETGRSFDPGVVNALRTVLVAERLQYPVGRAATIS